MEEKNRSEKWWINMVRVFAVLIGFSPFIPNLLYYWNFRVDKNPLTLSDGWFIIIGFVFLWGSSNFGTWANKLGAGILDKLGKK